MKRSFLKLGDEKMCSQNFEAFESFEARREALPATFLNAALRSPSAHLHHHSIHTH